MTQTIPGTSSATPDLVPLRLPPDRHSELVALLYRHAQHWLDEADRLDVAADHDPARAAILTAAVGRCREQAAAALALREWVYSPDGPRQAADTFHTAGGAVVRVLATNDGGGELHCYGCLYTVVEYPDVTLAQSNAARHAEHCQEPPVALDAPYRESVARPTDDFWGCPCGNDTMASGFSACDAQGQPIEPDADSGWDQVSNVCLDCGRVIEQDAGIVLARVTLNRDDRDQ